MGISIETSTMTPSPSTVELYKGQSKVIYFTFTDEEADVYGNIKDIPFDLTGAVLYFTVRSRPGSPSVLITKTSDDPLQIEILSPPEEGRARLFLDPEDTRLMTSEKYCFDVWVELLTGAQFPLISVSEFIIKDPVTVIPH